jgi:hypothetical protein
MTQTQRHSRGFSFSISIALFLLAIAAPLLVRDAKIGTEDFGHFYRAADAMRHGQDIYAATNGHYIYPPLLAFLLQPLSFLPENVAVVVWLVLSALAIFGAAAIAAKETTRRWLGGGTAVPPHWPWAIAAAATFLAADKLHKMFGLGQSDAFILLGFALVFPLMNRRPWIAGVLVGAVGNVKYLSVIFVPYFVVKRNYRAAIGAVLSFAFFLLLPALQVGLMRGLGYASAAFGGLGHMFGIAPKQRLKILEVTWDRSISITSALFRLTRSAQIPDLATVALLLLILGAVVGAMMLVARRHGIALFSADQNRPPSERSRVETLEWAVLIFVAVAFSPQITARHMVLTLLIYTVAIPIFLALTEGKIRILIALAISLMVASLSLPPSGNTLDFWRGISGANWCAMILTIAIVWSGSRAIAIPNEHRTGRTLTDAA